VLYIRRPNVAYNFVYRPPRTANEWQLWYFASRDPDIARTLARHFFWNESILFKEELRGVPRVAAVVAGDDQIVHAEEVRRYLTGHEEAKKVEVTEDGIEVRWYEGVDHAVIFEREGPMRELVELVLRYCGEAPGKEEKEANGGEHVKVGNGHAVSNGHVANGHGQNGDVHRRARLISLD
jgi:hypothetical protein